MWVCGLVGEWVGVCAYDVYECMWGGCGHGGVWDVFRVQFCVCTHIPKKSGSHHITLQLSLLSLPSVRPLTNQVPVSIGVAPSSCCLRSS